MSRMKSQRGFTILELFCVIAVLGLLLAGMYNTVQSQHHAYVVQEQAAEINQHARIALDIMGMDIRAAAYDPTRVTSGGGAGARVQTANSNAIEYTNDTLDATCLNQVGDGTISCVGEWIGFRWNIEEKRIDKCFAITNCAEGDWQPFVDGIQTLQFNYVYADGDSSSDPVVGFPDDTDADDTNDFEDIREVQIQIVAARRSQLAGGLRSINLTSRVQVRNLAIR